MQSHNERRQARAKAFTLVELIAITLVIVSLGAVLGPALTRTAPLSAAAQCRNNLRQLGSGWTMYAQDNDDRLVYNHDGVSAGWNRGLESWVAGWLDTITSGSPPGATTNTDFLIDHKHYPYGAYLGPYIRTPQYFHCPADHSTAFFSSTDRRPRVRSYSMNCLVGGRAFSTPNAFLVFSNLTQFSHPDGLFTILDEHEDSINDGTYFVEPNTPYHLEDFPAARHNNGAGFSFADGHAITQRWLDPRTMPPVRGQNISGNIVIPGDVDVLWIHEHGASRY